MTKYILFIWLKMLAKKRALLILQMIICLSLLVVRVESQTLKTSLSISGIINGLPSETKLCMVIKRNNKIDTVSTAIANKGVFKFLNVKLPVYPDFYLVCIQTQFVDNLQLFLDQTGDIKIIGDLKNWPNVRITGSKAHDDYLKAKNIITKVWSDTFQKKYPDGTAPPDSGMAYSLKTRLAVVKEIPDSEYIPAMIVLWEHPGKAYGFTIDPIIKESFYNGFTNVQKNSHYGRILSQQINAYEDAKLWMEKLGKTSTNISSISKDEVSNQLTENVNKTVMITSLSVAVKHLSIAELEAKSKSATLILNMGYRNPGDSVAKANPTSAYVIDGSGVCVTNYHVGKEYSSKAPYQSLSVMTAEGKSYPVTKILSCSENDDLMVFQLDTRGDKLSALPLANKLADGAKIHVMGHPQGKFYQFTSGAVSGYSTSTLAGKPSNIMSITADFNIGSSGGPIVDDYGNVVGTVSRLNGEKKIGVPVSELKKLIEFKK